MKVTGSREQILDRILAIKQFFCKIRRGGFAGDAEATLI